MNIIYIPMDETGLDDLFIYKHKLEKQLNIEQHIPYTQFIKEYVFGKNMLTYYDSKSSEAIPFSMLDIGDDKVIIHAIVDDEALSRLKTVLNSLNYSFSTLHKVSQLDSTAIIDPTAIDFFITPDNKMLVDNERLEEVSIRYTSNA